MKLAATIHRVKDEGDYSIRVEKPSDDEIGELYEEFNAMLSRIEFADEALHLAHEELRETNAGLEERVLARTEELSLERKELMNNVVAIAPWTMLIVTFVLLAIFFKRWTRVRIIQRDPRGDAPLLLDVVDGVAYDADRHPTSTAGLQRADLKSLPLLSASDHTQTTARDQMLDLANQ